LLSAFFFAASMICTRRGVLRIKDPALGGYISVFVGPPLFLLAALAMSDLHSITTFSWKGYVFLAVAGIMHFVLGRSYGYWSVKHLGANMASIFVALNPIYTILLGVLILGEQMTGHAALGSALIVIGPAALFWPERRGMDKTQDHSSKPRLSKKGITAALVTGLCYGITPLFIKWGLQQGGSALAGTFISYASATFVLCTTMIKPVRREAVVTMERRALAWFALSGLFVGMAQLFRYIALKLSPISIVGSLTATTPVFLLLLSLILNRRVESFRFTVILGAIMVVIGTLMVYR
ncbi:MAG: EamA family transporter, partial [Dehalococcoidia bacterium]|nr:EamA family transporter [Dehalococcoidia bacterium]